MDNRPSHNDDDYYADMRKVSTSKRVGIVIVFFICYFVVTSVFAVDLETDNGATLEGGEQTFTWPSDGGNQFVVRVGSTLGNTDIYYSADTGAFVTTNTLTLSGLPTDGSTLFLYVWDRRNQVGISAQFISGPAPSSGLDDQDDDGSADDDGGFPDDGPIDEGNEFTGEVNLSEADRGLLVDVSDRLDVSNEVLFYGGLMGVIFMGFSIGERYGR